jgi:hypothetical protein
VFAANVYNVMGDVAEVVNGFIAGVESTAQPFRGQLYNNNPSDTFASYFNGDTSVGVTQAMYPFAVGSLDAGAQLYWNRWAMRALNYLPEYSADTLEVYQSFFDNFGTGVITTASSGAMVEVISRFPYYLVSRHRRDF